MEAAKRERPREDEETNDEASLVLPPEIITEILLRLPAKSIGRFKCVSKLFCSVSSDPGFLKSHLDLTLRNDAVRSIHRKIIVSSRNLFSLDFDSIGDGSEGIRDLVAAVELNYPLKDDRSTMCQVNGNSYRRRWVEIVGSSNGLVCISPVEGAVFLYNPTIGDSKRLPETPVEYERCNFRTYGFGFDDLTHDYKVVKLVATTDSKNILEASVYSLKADSWRRICSLNYKHNDAVYTSGVHFNGAIHWGFTLQKEDNQTQRVVVAFDLQTEELREMPLPFEAMDCLHMFRNFVVGILNGRLCVFNCCGEVHDDIWVMNEYGEAKSWSRIRISLLYKFMQPQCSTKNDEEVLLMLNGDMVLYNFKTGAIREMGIRGVKAGAGAGGFQANTYVESLISPNTYNL